MESPRLTSISSLSPALREDLRRANIHDVADLLLTPIMDLARKCRLPELEVTKRILIPVCRELSQEPVSLQELAEEEETFTTGDATLDGALGGGIRTGMLWEIVGESAAGKTQLALQLSLMVQLPETMGGLNGACCYLTTAATLPTTRLVEMIDVHPVLSPALSSLSDIHTIKTPEIPVLLHVLRTRLPTLVEGLTTAHAKPIKLLVIDALAELFHSHDRTSSETLFERSRNLTEISALLHALASRHQLAVVVLNEVADVFERPFGPDEDARRDVIYHEQARWFARAHSMPGENRKEASLGLVWANQVNHRIMLTRTERARVLGSEEQRQAKRRRLDASSQALTSEPQLTRIRRLSIIFSTIAAPVSMDYIVTEEGVTVLPDTSEYYPTAPQSPVEIAPPGLETLTAPESIHGVSLLDVGSLDGEPSSSPNNEQSADVTGPETSSPSLPADAEAVNEPQEFVPTSQHSEEDEWATYWREADA